MGSEPVTVREEPWARARELFCAHREGEAGALDDLVRLLTPVLWHVVRAYRLDQEVAADVVQATWLAFCRAQDSITDPGAVSKWLITTARREAARTFQRGQRTVAVDDDELGRRIPAQRSSEAEAVEHDRDDQLWRAVAQLDPRCQRLLRVVAFSPRPDYAHLADELGMPVGSIGPTRGRCLKKLKDALGEGGLISEGAGA